MWGLWKITYFYIIIPRRRKGRWRDTDHCFLMNAFIQDLLRGHTLTPKFSETFWIILIYAGKYISLHCTYKSKWLCMGPILGNWLPYPDLYFWQIQVKMSHYLVQKYFSTRRARDGEVAVHSGWFRKDSELFLHLSNEHHTFFKFYRVWIQFKSYQFCVESAEETCNISHIVMCRKGESAPVAFSIKQCVTPLLFLGWPIVLSFLTLLEKKFSAASYSNSCVWSLKSWCH